jgi:hypothetical protein
MDPRVRFLARGPGYGIYLTGEGATLALQQEAAVSMHLVGARRDVEPVGSDVQAGQTNYFVGNDPAKWRTGIEGYGRVRYPGVLSGVDVVYYGTGQRRLEYDLVLAPGTDPRGVAVAFDGAESVSLDGEGAAVVRLPGSGEVVQPMPVAFQMGAEGLRTPVDVRFEVRAGALGFVVGAFDPRRALVIDPTLVYSTYLGGSTNDQAQAVAVDSSGEAFVVGTTSSTDFPAFPFTSTFQHFNAGGADAFVSKFNAAGSALVYSTYIGGSFNDDGLGIAVDSAGEAFVVGNTKSTDFPTASPFQSTNNGGTNGIAFVTKLNAAGSALVYSTYLGGSGPDSASSVAVDGSGEAFVTGYTRSSNFPSTSAFQGTNFGGADAFVAKFNAAGSALVYSTYLGGNQDDFGTAIALDGAGEVFVTGYTQSTNFRTSSPFQAASGGGTDAFLTKFNAGGSALVYSTYLGGTANDFGYGIALDNTGDAFVTGSTLSTNFPTQSPYQAAKSGNSDAFITKFNAGGSALVYSTYLGGTGPDTAAAIAVDVRGEAFVAGSTDSPNFPLASPILSSPPAFLDAFVTKFNAAGSALVYSTYLGGASPPDPSNAANGIAVDSAGDAFVAGYTNSINFPTASPYRGNLGGAMPCGILGSPPCAINAFVAKISSPLPPPPAVPALTPWNACLAGLLLFVVGVWQARIWARTARRRRSDVPS